MQIKSFSRFYPRNYVLKISRMISFAGKKQDAEEFLGKTFVYSIAGLLLGFGLSITFGLETIVAALVALGLGAGINMISFMSLFFLVDARTKKAEQALPDMLQLMASNLRAGMTPYQAMIMSKRPEFGPLEEELNYATTKALGNENFYHVLMNMGKRINSSLIERTMKLIISSLKSGGHLANLLEELAQDISDTRGLKNEITANTKTYTMFILFAVLIGAPLLFAISIHFVGVVEGMQSKSNIATADFGLGLMSGELSINTAFLANISIVTLIITSLLACMLVGVITRGNQKYGLRYVPIVMGGSIIMFFIARTVVTNMFVGLTS